MALCLQYAGRIDAGNDSLRHGFFVAGSAVDLASKV